MPPIEPVPAQGCFPWEAPDTPGLPPSPSRDRLTLTSDVSESASDTVRHLRAMGVDIHTKPLRCSYAIGQVGIQKRTIDEMDRALQDSSLFLRSILLAQPYRYRLLICEDFSDTSPSRRIWGEASRAAHQASIPALVTPTPIETARLILWLGGVCTCRHRKRKAIRHGRKTTAPTPLNMLETLPGVGTALAEQLCRRYGRLGIAAT